MPEMPAPLTKPTSGTDGDFHPKWPSWLWQGALPPLGRDRLLREITQAIQDKTAFHLHGPAGRGKATLAATLAREHIARGGRVLWLDVGAQPLTALLCRIARHFPDDPRAQAALKMRHPSEATANTAPIHSLARCLRERQPLLVLADATDIASLAPWVKHIAGALPILSFGETALGDGWPGAEQLLPALDEEAARATVQRAAGGETADWAALALALENEPLALALCGAALQAGDPSIATDLTAAANGEGMSNPSATDRVLLAVIPQLPPAAQGLLLLLAFSPQKRQTLAELQRSNGATAEELAELRQILQHYALIRSWPAATRPAAAAPTHESIAIVKPVRQFLQQWADQAGTAAELQRHTQEAAFQQLRAVLRGGAETWPQLPDLLQSLSAPERADAAQWRALQDLWQAAASELEARGFAYELQELQRRAALLTEEPAPTIHPAAADSTPAEPGLPVLAEDETAPQGDVHPSRERMPDAGSVDDLSADEGSAEEAFAAEETLTTEQFPAAEWSAGLDWEEDERAYLPREAAAPFDEGYENEEYSAEEDADEASPAAEKRTAALLPPSRSIAEEAATREAVTGKDESDSHPLWEELPPFFPSQETVQAEEFSPTEQMAQLQQNGAAELERGEIDAAIASLSAALDIAEDLTQGATCAEILYLLGCAQLEDGASDAAIASLNEAQERFEAVGDAKGMTDALGALGNALGELGRWSEAAESHRAAVRATRRTGDQTEEALQLNALAYAHRRCQQLGGAVRSYRQALFLAYERQDANAIAQTAAELAEVLMNSPRHLAIAQLLLDAALAAGAPDQDVTELRQAIAKALQKAETAGIQQAPVRGDAHTYARQAYDAHNARQGPS